MDKILKRLTELVYGTNTKLGKFKSSFRPSVKIKVAFQKVENDGATKIYGRTFLKKLALLVFIVFVLSSALSTNAQEVKRVFGGTPLIRAARFYAQNHEHFLSQIKQMQLLIDNGEDVNATDEKGHTALMFASLDFQEWPEIVNMLIENGADVNSRDDKGQTALMYAANFGYFTTEGSQQTWHKWMSQSNTRIRGTGWVVKMLLKAGADVHATDMNGKTAADIIKQHMNIYNRRAYAPMLNTIRDYGGDVEGRKRQIRIRWFFIIFSLLATIIFVKTLVKKNNRQQLLKSLIKESYFGHEITVKQLLDDGLDIRVKCDEVDSALSDAVQQGHIKIVELLLNGGANASALHVLHTAIWTGRLDIAETLISHGSDVNIKYNNNTLLIEVMKYDNNDFVELLLKKGADINMSTPGGWTALMVAVSYGHVEIVKTLLREGADVNIANSHGNAIAQAASKGHVEIVKILLKNGFDSNTDLNNEKTVLDAARENGNPEIKKMLIEAGAKESGALLIENFFDSIESGDITTVKEMLKKNIDIVNARGRPKKGEYGKKIIGDMTALIFAVDKSQEEIVKILLKNGADTEMYNYLYGYTALMTAVLAENLEIVKILINGGANVNRKRFSTDHTPLVEAKLRHNHEIVKVLLDAGAEK